MLTMFKKIKYRILAENNSLFFFKKDIADLENNQIEIPEVRNTKTKQN